MPASGHDPFQTLGVSSRASDDEVRTAYHRLVQQHHPDHNGGSAESARRFEEVQDAYARIRELRRRAQPPPASGPDPDGDARLADLERQVREAQATRERAQRAAREAARDAAARAGRSQTGRRASDEELGYVTTDDSFSKIFSDARDELAERLSGAREHPAAQRVADLIDELEGLISPKPPPRK